MDTKAIFHKCESSTCESLYCLIKILTSCDRRLVHWVVQIIPTWFVVREVVDDAEEQEEITPTMSLETSY